jgi:hypothetical protein
MRIAARDREVLLVLAPRADPRRRITILGEDEPDHLGVVGTRVVVDGVDSQEAVQPELRPPDDELVPARHLARLGFGALAEPVLQLAEPLLLRLHDSPEALLFPPVIVELTLQRILRERVRARDRDEDGQRSRPYRHPIPPNGVGPVSSKCERPLNQQKDRIAPRASGPPPLTARTTRVDDVCMRGLTSFVLASGCLVAGSLAATRDVRPARIGEPVPAIRFTDIRYLSRSLDELGVGASAVVLFFTGCECPIAQRYLPRLGDMERAYRARGVRFAAVNAAIGDSIVEMAEQAVEARVEFPFVKDLDGDVAQSLGVERLGTAVPHFDNSAWNLFNPDPTATVKFGLQTSEEMMYGYLFFTEDAEDLGIRVNSRNGWVLAQGTAPAR